MNCISCSENKTPHKCCVRHAKCWVNKLYFPNLCSVCSETFRIASSEKHSDERSNARAAYIDWFRALLPSRKKANLPRIWPSDELRKEFSSEEWFFKLADSVVGEEYIKPVMNRSSASEDYLVSEIPLSDNEDEFVYDDSRERLDIQSAAELGQYNSFFLDKLKKHEIYIHLQYGLPTLLKPINLKRFCKKPPFTVGSQRLMKSSYWKHVHQKLNDSSIDMEEIESYVQGRIEKILQYFEKLYADSLDAADIGDRRAGKFEMNGPYLPDPAELEVSTAYFLCHLFYFNLDKDSRF